MDLADDLITLHEDQKAWTVHDGKFFANALIHEHRARAPAERKMASSDQLSAWVDGCTDFLGGSEAGSSFEGLHAESAYDVFHGEAQSTHKARDDGRWSVHDGMAFADHVRSKRPRAPAERRAHKNGVTFDSKRWCAGDAAEYMDQTAGEFAST